LPPGVLLDTANLIAQRHAIDAVVHDELSTGDVQHFHNPCSHPFCIC
jgi:hypothetical protein